MSAILKFDFQKRKQLRFSEVNYLIFTKKTFSLKQGETRTNSVPIPHPLREAYRVLLPREQLSHDLSQEW